MCATKISVTPDGIVVDGHMRLRAAAEAGITNIPVQVKISDGDIVPELYQNRLMIWRDLFKRGYFEIGDIANELCLLAAQNGFKVTQERIYRAVGRFCDRTGHTVHYYARTASFFAPEVRIEFDELPFSHFAFAMTVKDWRNVLEYAMAHPEVSAEQLERLFIKKAMDDMDYETFRHGEVVSDEQIMRESSQEPAAGREMPINYIRASHLSALSSLVDILDRILGHLKLRDETRNRLSNALDDIRLAMPEIIEATKGDNDD